MDFTKAELVLLDEALTSRIRAMVNELVHTDDRRLREQLKQSLAELETLERKVTRAVAA